MTTETSTQTAGSAGAVYQAIYDVMTELSETGIAKSEQNRQQGYNFRGIDAVLNALSPMLVKHKLLVMPRVLSRSTTERPTARGGVLFFTSVEVEYDFVSPVDGSKHTIRTIGEAMDSADKSTNKAMSAAYKYAAIQAFCIPTEGEDDADYHTHEVVNGDHHHKEAQNNVVKPNGGGRQSTQQQPIKQETNQQDAQVAALMRKLLGAAKLGTPAFNQMWAENPGQSRAIIFNDEERMNILKKEKDAADARMKAEAAQGNGNAQ